MVESPPTVVSWSCNRDRPNIIALYRFWACSDWDFNTRLQVFLYRKSERWPTTLFRSEGKEWLTQYSPLCYQKHWCLSSTRLCTLASPLVRLVAICIVYALRLPRFKCYITATQGWFDGLLAVKKPIETHNVLVEELSRWCERGLWRHWRKAIINRKACSGVRGVSIGRHKFLGEQRCGRHGVQRNGMVHLPTGYRIEWWRMGEH